MTQELLSWREKYEDIFSEFKGLTIPVPHVTKAYKYNNAAELAYKISEWFIYQRENNLGISIIALCVHLKIARQTLDLMKSMSPEFKHLVDVTKNCIEEYWVQNLGTSETAARFILSTMPHYTTIEKQIIESDNFVINVKKPE